MSNESENEEFSEFSYSSGHSDIALAVYVTKNLEHVIRKYSCGDLAVSARIPLGRLIKDYSDIGSWNKNLVWNLMSLVEKRNNLVHKIEVGKFENKSGRRHFVESSNRVLKILSKKRQSNLSFSTLAERLGVWNLAGGSIVADPGHTRMEIKRPEEDSSDNVTLDYHCWNMIKKDPVLQKSISDDVDGLFKDLLPIPFEEYLAIVPTDDIPDGIEFLLLDPDVYDEPPCYDMIKIEYFGLVCI